MVCFAVNFENHLNDFCPQAFKTKFLIAVARVSNLLDGDLSNCFKCTFAGILAEAKLS